MTGKRIFFNGVSALRLERGMISFSFEDIQPINGEMDKRQLDSFITDIETLDGITQFMAAEIKKMRDSSSKIIKSEKNEQSVSTDSGEKIRLGKKLEVSSSEH